MFTCQGDFGNHAAEGVSRASRYFRTFISIEFPLKRGVIPAKTKYGVSPGKISEGHEEGRCLTKRGTLFERSVCQIDAKRDNTLMANYIKMLSEHPRLKGLLSFAATVIVVLSAGWHLLSDGAGDLNVGPQLETVAQGETQRESASDTVFDDGVSTLPDGTTSEDPPSLSSGPRDATQTSGGSVKSSSTRGPPEADDDDESDGLQYGILREIQPDRFMSPQGLQYVPGSAEGHRLEHLRRHTADQPSRPGKHGVFDGGMEGALKTIDRAYELAKKKQRTTKQVDGKRTIYTVDLGKRVGFVGGREGNRRRKPMARRVKLVLEGNRVITAFPL